MLCDCAHAWRLKVGAAANCSGMQHVLARGRHVTRGALRHLCNEAAAQGGDAAHGAGRAGPARRHLGSAQRPVRHGPHRAAL